jgi:hypothetical protein
MRAGLVGDRVGADAAGEHLGHHFGRIAEQPTLVGSVAAPMISSASSMVAARRSR